MAHDMQGFNVDDRVIEDGAEVTIVGTIKSLNADAGTAWVHWDNGHDEHVDIDILVPKDGF